MKRRLSKKEGFQLLVRRYQQGNPRLDATEMPQKDEDDGSGFLRELRLLDEQLDEAIRSHN